MICPFLSFLGERGSDDEIIQSDVGSGRIGTPLEMHQEEAIRRLHEKNAD
jgi:hypothetical protein